jgi:hypothetical protein
MGGLIAVLLVSVFLLAFVGFPLLAARDFHSRGYRVAPQLLMLFAALVVTSLVVDLIATATLSVKPLTPQTGTPPKTAPPGKLPQGPPGEE